MKRSLFDYDLPQRLIAQHPAAARDGARMLVLHRDTGGIQHRRFTDLPELLSGREVVVCNDSRVFPARLQAVKESGGRVELLVLRWTADGAFAAMTRASKPLRPGMRLRLVRTGTVVEVTAVPGAGRAELHLSDRGDVLSLCEAEGVTPLPPYIRRDSAADDTQDRERYQTVFARTPGSVAAPTAGLHFSPAVLEHIRAAGAQVHSVTLHVGPGTFEPVRAEDIEDHRMEEEWYSVPDAAADAVNRALAEKRPVMAIGTTAVRCLESAGSRGTVAAGDGATSLFIAPGYCFRVVNRLLTNFHLPGSTLLMLVCAFAGTERVLAAYREAVKEEYRFYSYGDCMLVLGDGPPG